MGKNNDHDESFAIYRYWTEKARWITHALSGSTKHHGITLLSWTSEFIDT